jgi:hypothetical protein
MVNVVLGNKYATEEGLKYSHLIIMEYFDEFYRSINKERFDLMLANENKEVI